MTEKWDIEGFAALLDAYGADRERWPMAQRDRFDALLRDSAAARRLLEEAAALDRLLEMAGQTEPRLRSADLTDRIVARALKTKPPAVGERPARGVIDLQARRPSPPSVGKRMHKPVDWRTAALLAASLLSGLYIGGIGLGDDYLNAATETIGLGAVVDGQGLILADLGVTTFEDDAL